MNLDILADFGLQFVVVLAAGYAAFAFAKLVIVVTQPNPVADYLGTGKKQPRQGQPALGDKVGAAIVRQLPLSLSAWETNLRWAQRGGEVLCFCI